MRDANGVIVQGRARLTRIMEILTAAQELGEQLKVEVLDEVIDALEAEHARAAAAVPPSTRPLTEEEQSLALYLAVVGGAIEHAIGFMEQRSTLFRLRNELAKVRDNLSAVAWQYLYGRMPRQLAVGVATEACAWRFVPYSPEEIRTLVDMLRQLSTGARVTKEMRGQAGALFDRMQGIAPAGQEAQVG